MSARLLMLVGGMMAAGAVRAERLSMEPSLGLASEYASNPYLLSAGAQAVEDVAVLADGLTRYDLDAWHAALEPSVRYSNSGSFASLNSNYVHVNGSASYASELDVVTLKGVVSRDSSLYQNGLSSEGLGVRADGTSLLGDWQRNLSERAVTEVGVSWSRELYNQGAQTTGVVDYRYLSLNPSATYALTERDKLQLSAGAGEYSSLNGITKSDNYNLQAGLVRQLSEIWTLSSSVGYARSYNSQSVYAGPLDDLGSPVFLGVFKGAQQGPVYNATLTRQGEQLNLSLSAYRAFVPSGFEFLSRQQIGQIDLVYVSTERWKFGAKFSYQDTATPNGTGSLVTVHYFSGQLSGYWQWTPTLSLSLQTTLVSVKYDLPPLSAQSTGVSLQISRQFLRFDL